MWSSNEEKSEPQNTNPSGALKHFLNGLAHTVPVAGKFCKFLNVQVGSLILPRIINPAHSYL